MELKITSTMLPTDIAYIADVLGTTDAEKAAIKVLLRDEESILDLLDDPRLFSCTIEQSDFSRVSAYLYFFISLRRFLTRRGISSAGVSWYVAGVIAYFSVSKQWNNPKHIWHRPRDHYTNILEKMRKARDDADSYNMYLLQVHLGDYSLFLSGLYPEYIQYMSTEKEGANVDYYDDMALTGYKAASNNQSAISTDISGTHKYISQYIPIIREAINDYAYSPYVRII